MSVVSPRFFSVAVLAILLWSGMGCSGGSQIGSTLESDPSVVAIIDGAPLSVAEFERQYIKTVGSREDAADDSMGAYRDFLDRWVDFRLKVRAARDAGLHEDSTLKAELSGYRQQFARPFLLDKSVADPLIRETFEKQKMMVDASHILVRISPTASPGDTLKAFNRIVALRDSVAAGADFGDIAYRHSEDPSASNDNGGAGYRGRLGFIRGGRLVPAFEDVAFTNPIGQLSDVFRTQFGYHVLVVHDRREASADVRIAHIMVTPESPDDSTAAWEEVRMIQDSLAAGADFAELARTHSDDNTSAGKGGDIGFIAIDGRLIGSIKDAAFALNDVGDVSEPVVTQFGIHLIKLLERRPHETLEDAYDAIRQRISRSGQLDKKEEEYARQILAETGFSVDTTAVRAIFGSMTADSAATVVARGALVSSNGSMTVASIGSDEYSASDLVKWAMSASVAQDSDAVDYALGLVDGFLVQKAIEHKVSTLEQENDEFRQTMTDFLDGLLLFRVMEDSVWSLATSDSTELLRRYNVNPQRFQHPDRTRLVGLYSRDRSVADSVRALLDDEMSPLQIVNHFADSSGNPVRMDTTLVAGSTNSVFDRALDLDEGEYTVPLSYNRGHIVIINGGIEPARTKTFDEARTEIVNEYQADLEERLIQKLRSRYRARTFPARLTNVFAAERMAATKAETAQPAG